MWGKFASRRGEARYPGLWDGRVSAWCPSVTGPTGTRLYDLQAGLYQGALTNMDSATDWVRSAGQYCLDFDGTNDHVLTTSKGTASPARTISLWMRYTGPGTGFRCAFDYGVLNFGQRLLVGYNGQNIVMDRYGGGLSVSGYYDLAWHHVAVADTAGAYSLYVDGKLGASGTQLSTPTLGTVYLGRAIDGAYFVGQIDDSAIYNRALTAGEIRTLSRRRGIAYEARRNQDFGSTTNRRLRTICGAEC